MNAIVEMLNTAGRAFVEFSLPMLIQSCVLILILVAVDAFLKRKVRAVFRYWIWMLVLVKLVLPPSLGSPVSVGMWFGDALETPAVVLLEPEPEPAELSPVISAILSPPDPGIAEPIIVPPSTTMPAPPAESARPQTPISTPAVPLRWQGLTLLTWAVVVLALAALLVQRAFFVRGLLGQSETASRSMLNELETCRRGLNLRRRIDLRLSPNATSPAVCGLLRPVILIPQSIAPRLQSNELQAILLHELAHVKRGDLWVNLVQTLVQIAYFYNPLLWLANAMIRRTREQAVDETVLVAMGETARQYPEILVNIAKLAFTRRPTLSLRLIGVVESKSALTGRIRHILSRPLPKTARLGVFGIFLITVVAVVLLPMARARPLPHPEPDVTAPVEEQVRTFVEAPVSSDFVTRLPEGVSVEFLGLHDCGSEKELWWRPDGESLPGAPYNYSSYLRSSEPNDTYEALFHISSPAGRTFGKMEWTRGRSTMPGYLHRDGRRGSSDIPDDAYDLFGGVLHGPPETGQVRIDIGVGLDNAWELLGVLDSQASQAVALSDAVINPAREEDGKTVVTVTHRISDKEVRLIAVDRNGSRYEEVGHTIRQGHDMTSYEPRFKLPLAEIRQFRLEAQKLTWMAFKNVSLRAGQKTDVRTLLPDGDREPPAQVEPVTPTTEPRSDATGATGVMAKLPNGATVEFLGTRDRAGGGGPWWCPDGEVLSVAPYDDSLVVHGGVPQTTYEVLFRISSPTGRAFAEMEWTAGRFSRYSPLYVLGDRNRTSNDVPHDADDLFNGVLDTEPGTDRAQIDVGVGLESAWEPLGALDAREPSVAVTVPGAVINPATEEEGKTSVTASNQFMDRVIRLVAVDKNGFVRKPTRYSFGRRDDASLYEATFDLPLAEIQSIRLEAQKLTRVVFKNVSLRPGQRTDVQIETESAGPGNAPAREVVLPEADKRPVVLDLGTGELVPMPPGPEPEKVQQALRELGKATSCTTSTSATAR